MNEYVMLYFRKAFFDLSVLDSDNKNFLVKQHFCGNTTD